MAVLPAWGHTPTTDAVIPSAGWVSNLAQIRAAINTIDQAQMNTNSVGTAQILALNVTRAKIALDAINGTLVADESIDSEHYVDGSIDNEHHAAGAIGADKLGNMFEGAQDDEVATDTVTETDWHDIVGSSVAITLDVASDLMCLGMTMNLAGVGAINSLRVVYDTGAGDIQVGQDGQNRSGHGAAEYFQIMAGGVASNLAADTYTFKLQGKVASGTGTYTKNNICVLSVPHR